MNTQIKRRIALDSRSAALIALLVIPIFPRVLCWSSSRIHPKCVEGHGHDVLVSLDYKSLIARLAAGEGET